MKVNRLMLLAAAGLVAVIAFVGRAGSGQTSGEPVVRLAEIEIDPNHLDEYKAALREGIEAALRFEPGVQALYAVSIKGHPDQIRVLEIYASQAAYQSHLQTPHFKKYKSTTQSMVRSLKLIETDPILLGTSGHILPAE